MKGTLNKDSIVKCKESDKEKNFKNLQVNWDPQAAVWVCGVPFIYLRAFSCLGSQVGPENDIAFPYSVDNSLYRSLTEEPFRSGHCSDLECIKAFKMCSQIGCGLIIVRVAVANMHSSLRRSVA